MIFYGVVLLVIGVIVYFVGRAFAPQPASGPLTILGQGLGVVGVILLVVGIVLLIVNRGAVENDLDLDAMKALLGL